MPGSALIEFNDSLEIKAFPTRLNETVIEHKIEALETIGSIWGHVYWLTLARINELALLCAANYADNCEFQGVGDFLVNPRLILVHIRGVPEPVVKERHIGLTEQFGSVAGTRAGIIAWLKNETFLEIKEEPLLPHFYNKLCDSGVVSLEYLDSVNTRMRKIADMSGFLASGHLHKGLDFHQCLQHSSDSDRGFVASRLCRFDTRTFYDLGHDFHQIIQSEGYKSKFLL